MCTARVYWIFGCGHLIVCRSLLEVDAAHVTQNMATKFGDIKATLMTGRSRSNEEGSTGEMRRILE